MKLFKRIGLFLLIGIVIFYISFSLFKGTRSLSDIPANETFDDINFYKCVVDAYNEDNDANVGYNTNLSDEQLNKIENLMCYDRNIISTKGIEKLVSLSNIQLAKNRIEDIDLSNNIGLESLIIDTNKLTKLDVSNNIRLRYLYINNNQLTKIDVSNNVELRILNASSNQLTKIDLSNNLELTYLEANFNQLSEIDVSKNLELTYLELSDNQLIEIDVSKNLKLTYLSVNFNQLTEIDVSNNVELLLLNVENNRLTKIDVLKNINLTFLYAYNNQLIDLDVSKNMKLNILRIHSNKLTKIDLSDNIKLEHIYINKNDFSYDKYVYVGNEFKLNNVVKLPEHLNVNPLKWFSGNNDIIEIIENDTAKAINVGNISIDGDAGIYDVVNNINVIEITSDKYLIDNENDIIDVDFESISYDEFISNIDVPDDISIKIFDGNNEIKSGNVSLGMKLKVYYNDEVLNIFTITDDNLKFDEDLIIKDEYISNISVGTSVSDLFELIDTNGSISVYDKNGNIIIGDKLISTGCIVKIVMNNKTIEYNLSVNGDVDGDGKLMLSDIMKISKYVYVDKKSLSDVYLIAADYNMDNEYNLQDIMKIASRIYKGGN